MTIFRVGIDHTSITTVSGIDTAVPAEPLSALRTEVLAAISGAGLTDFDIVHVEKVPGGTRKTSYEVWVQGS